MQGAVKCRHLILWLGGFVTVLQRWLLGKQVVIALAIMLLSSASLPSHKQEKISDVKLIICKPHHSQQFSIVFCSVGFLQEVLKL